MGCVKKGEGDVFSVGILDEPTKDTMEGEIEGTEESKLNISAMLPRLSTALPCLTLLKQHGRRENPSGEVTVSSIICSRTIATSTSFMSYKYPVERLGSAVTDCRIRPFCFL